MDEVEHNHKYFTGKHDLAFFLTVNWFLLFNWKCTGPSATSIILQNLNLPPEIQTHLENLICIGVIPSSHQLKNLSSFLAPLDDECAALANSIHTINAEDQTKISLYGYMICKNGDIIMIEKLLNLKGHNAYCSCWLCKIKGIYDIGNGGTVYYTPLATPDKPD